jgi:hypothetical protein
MSKDFDYKQRPATEEYREGWERIYGKINVVAAVKDAARTHIGAPPPSRVIQPKKRRAPRHKETTRRLMERE